MSKSLKIVTVASEVAPFSKTGGLADVTRSLPKALKRLGHESMVITPLYGKVVSKEKFKLKKIFSDINIELPGKVFMKVNYWQGYLMDDLPIYFIENQKYFSKRKTLYCSTHENLRFMLFDVAALKLIILLKYKPDIIHCHDWHTGMIPYFLKTDFKLSSYLGKAKTIFTIHNLVFQMGQNWWQVPSAKKDYGKSKLPPAGSPDIENVNFAKRAIMTADVINTVSEQYREEIMTKHFGQDLHRILRNRENRLFGIINGIDYNAYNPGNDENLHKNYDFQKISLKKNNKLFLQKKLKLPENANLPILCATSRVTFQKGFQLILQLLDHLVKIDMQIIILGDGDKEYISELKRFVKKYPKKIIWLSFKEHQKLETLIYAASDFFLLPSHHEPCGINQLIAMRYGCIPIVRKVGGLYDTVDNFNPVTRSGNGFTFTAFDTFALYGTIIRALETYKYKDTWNAIASKAMQISNSWEIPAKKYVALYRRSLKL